MFRIALIAATLAAAPFIVHAATGSPIAKGRRIARAAPVGEATGSATSLVARESDQRHAPGGPAAGAQTQPARPAPPAQSDPFTGNWRGTVTSAAGGQSPIIITLAKKGDAYVGSTNGLNASSESALKRVAVTSATTISIEASDDSKLGVVTLASELTLDGNTLKGAGTLTVGALKFDVTLALQRRPRAEAIQPHVEQRIEYFVGRWAFEYVGAEYPPLSAGSRGGTATFARTGASNFVTGTLDGEVNGKAYQETVSIGLDPDTNSLAFVERRPDGVELVSVASWRSPIAISVQTSPVVANGKIYQLRRLISVRSATAFDVTEEFSIDGAPFRRLGDAHYTKRRE
jgi:hypothetical protein